MKNLVTAQLSNKLFLRTVSIKNKSIVFNKNFLIYGSNLNFKLIKSLIELELFFGQRPKMIASFVKKSLVINLKITSDYDKIVFYQKSPVIWKRYLSMFNLFDHYSVPPFLQKRSGITISTPDNSVYKNWLKSAYLD